MKPQYNWPTAAAAAATLAAFPIAVTIALAPAASADAGETDSSSTSDTGDSDDAKDTSEAADSSAEKDEQDEHDEDGDADEEDEAHESVAAEADSADESESEEQDNNSETGSAAVESEPEPEPEQSLQPIDSESSAGDRRAPGAPEAEDVLDTAEVVESVHSVAESGELAPPTPDARTESVVSQPVLDSTTTTTLTAVEPTPPVVAAAVAVTQKAFTVTTKVIATVALPLLFWVPEDVPASQAPLLAVLSWVRREFEYIARDLGPTARPNQMLQDDDNLNVILGTLVAQGVHNDPVDNRVPLTYEVVQQPTNGTAEIGEHGDWIYTPNADSPGGPDTFVVKITDDAFHLDNLVGLPGHSTLVTVNVNDAASAQASADESNSAAPQAMMMAASSSGEKFYVYNLSQYDVAVIYTGTTDPGTKYDGYDPSGYTTYATGEVIEHTISSENETVYMVIKTVENDQVYHVALLNGYDEGYAYEQTACSASGNGASCTPSWKKVSSTYGTYEEMTDGDNVILLDAPGTVVTIPASETDEQNDTLDNLCDDDNVVCDWDVDSRTYYLAAGEYPQTYTSSSGQQLDFSPAYNASTNPDDYVYLDYSYSYSTDSSQSWDVSESVGVTLFEVVDASVSASYGESTSEDNSWSESIDLTVSPGETGYIFFQAPMYDVQGDFVITGGNTTWYVEDTHYYTTATDQAGKWTAQSSASAVTPPAEVYPAG